jgi:hypothetical protein
VKPEYNVLLPKSEENKEARKKLPASKLYTPVARLIVGIPLDAEFLDQYGASLGIDLSNPAVRAEALKRAHGTKVYKDEFDRRLGELFDAGKPDHPQHAEAVAVVRQAMEQARLEVLRRDVPGAVAGWAGNFQE